MNLELDKTYVLRNQKLLRITDDVSDFDPIYLFRGWVYNKDGSIDRFGFWLNNGRYKLSSLSGYDALHEVGDMPDCIAGCLPTLKRLADS